MPVVNAKHLIFFLLFLTICTSCVAPRIVRPLEKGQKAFRIDAGMVIDSTIKYNKTTRFILELTYAKAINEKTTGFFTLRANYFLWPVFEGGFVHAFAKPKGIIPGFSTSITGGLMPFYDGRNYGVFPTIQFAPNLYREFSEKKHFIYFGANGWLWPGSDRLILFTPQIGSSLVFKQYEFNLEAQYIPEMTELLFENKSACISIGLTRKF